MTAGAQSMSGSSPHARGAPVDLHRHHRSAGLIPACAGSTVRVRQRPPGRRAHPRMRGEHSPTVTPTPEGAGSSPHARGAQQFFGAAQVVERLIPACAGSTCPAGSWPTCGWAHPRMRGEHHGATIHHQPRGGSSPHARGARWHVAGRFAGRGLIPACAGSTVDTSTGRTIARAHPRMRGEHVTGSSSGWSWTGSSPHARGARRLVLRLLRSVRLIPACAGSTTRSVMTRGSPRAHPRMRGEHFGVHHHRVRAAGLIPACAGSTR